MCLNNTVNCYRERRRAITNGIMLTLFNTIKNVLIVWDPDRSLEPDYVTSILSKNKWATSVNHNWGPWKSSSSESIWQGAVATFSHEIFAKVAARNLRLKSKSIRTMPFKDYLDLLITSETQNLHYEKRGTRLRISGVRNFRLDDIYHFELNLNEFGNVLSTRFYASKSFKYGVKCEVVYEFASQAFAAKTLLNGSFSKKWGILTAEVEMKGKEKSIMNYVKNILFLKENNDSDKTVEELFVLF